MQGSQSTPSTVIPRCSAALAICGIAAIMAGCSVSVGSGTKTVDQPDSVAAAKKFLTSIPPDLWRSVDCPSGTEAKVGTTFECTATLPNGQEGTISLRVTAVNGDHVELHLNSAAVQQALAVGLVYKTAESPPKSVDCPVGIPATVGKTFDCRSTLKAGPVSTVTLKVEKPTSGPQNLRVVGTTVRGEFSKQAVEQQASGLLAKSVGEAPASVRCPAGLALKTGASEHCTLTANNGKTLGMTVTVTSATSNGHYQMHVAVAKH